MPDMIRDGKGKGFLAEVDLENRLKVYSTMENEISYESEINKRSFSWVASYNAGDADTVIWIKNTSTNKNLIIDRVILATDVATWAILHSPKGTTAAGTIINSVNTNRSSANTADASAYQNETGNSQGDIIAKVLLTAGVTTDFPTNGGIVLETSNEIAVDFVTGSTVLMSATIIGYYHEA